MKHTIDTLFWFTGCILWGSACAVIAIYLLNQLRIYIANSKFGKWVSLSIVGEIYSAIWIWVTYELLKKQMPNYVSQFMLDRTERKRPYFYKQWKAYFTHKLKTAPEENE